ncbi:IucA/IucC family protein [Streptomyces tricolor]|nr:IucA/IucC family protein [Streptomyces tricolor]
MTTALLLGAGAGDGGGTAPGDGGGPGGDADLVARVADSVRRTAAFIRHRRAHPPTPRTSSSAPSRPSSSDTPCTRPRRAGEGLTEAEADRYSPETRGSFPLHWLAVAPSLLAADSAWTERGRPVPADHLIRRIAGTELPLPDGYTAPALHPWQAREVRHRASVAALLDSGLLRDLGPLGTCWSPPPPVRTVHRSGASAMLKLSLALRTSPTPAARTSARNSTAESRCTGCRGTGLAIRWQAAHAPASTSSATRPGWPWTGAESAHPCRGST